jgi:hypothetical protein
MQNFGILEMCNSVRVHDSSKLRLDKWTRPSPIHQLSGSRLGIESTLFLRETSSINSLVNGAARLTGNEFGT